MSNLVFETQNNHEIYDAELLDKTKYIYLRGSEYVDFYEWPANLKLLETAFRPNLKSLPASLEMLSITTQNEVLKKDLPTKLKKLMITCPNSGSVTFDPQSDDFDLYKLSVKTFSKYNRFVGGYADDDQDNVKHHPVIYNYHVEGDIYSSDLR